MKVHTINLILVKMTKQDSEHFKDNKYLKKYTLKGR